MADIKNASTSPPIQSPPYPSAAIRSTQTPPAIPTARTTPESTTSLNQESPEQKFLQPFLFISSQWLPLERFKIDRLRERWEEYDIEDVKMDNLGYYISFPHGDKGMEDAQRCYNHINGTSFRGHMVFLEPFIQVTEDAAPWHRCKPKTDAWFRLERFGSLYRAPGEEIARFFDYDSMEHFMRCMGWNFLDEAQYNDAEAMLTSWKAEATHVLDPKTNIRR